MSSFEQYFSALHTLTVDSLPDTVWFDAGSPQQANSFRAAEVEICQLTNIYDRNGGEHDLALGREHDVPGTYVYRRWQVSDPETAHSFSHDVVEGQLSMGGQRYPADRFKQATVPALVTKFSRAANGEGDLAIVADRFAQWLQTDPDIRAKAERSVVLRAAGNLVIKDLLLHYRNGGSSSVPEALAPAHASRPGMLAISTALGNTLTEYTAVGTYPKGLLPTIDKSAVVKAIEAYDNQGLVPEEFWLNYGILKATPESVRVLLPLLHDKVIGGGVRPSPKSELPYANIYATAMLASYRADTARIADMVENIIKATRESSASDRISAQSLLELPLVCSTGARTIQATLEDTLDTTTPAHLEGQAQSNQFTQNTRHSAILAALMG